MFEGLAFPVVKVRYAGPTDTKGSRWIATLRRSRDEVTRVTAGYHSELPAGADNAYVAARECFAKHLASWDSDNDASDYVAVPGDLDPDTYVFTFVPAELLA